MIRRLSTSLLTVVAVMSLLTFASAESQRAMTRHTRDVVVNKTVAQLGHLPTSQRMRLTIALPLRDQAGLDAFLVDVRDPNSPLFRQFLTVDEFTSKFGPTQADYDTLIQFVEENGFKVEETTRNRVNLEVTATVGSIEKAFHVNMGLYQHPTEARTFFAPDREPTADLPFQLFHINGLDNFSTPHHMVAHRNASSQTVHTSTTPGSCPGPSYCGSDMRAAYYGSTTLTGAGQSVGIFELLGTDLTDLDDYFTNAGQTNNVPITLQSVGGNSTSCTWAKGECDDTEQTLDMTQAISMAPGLSSLVMYCGGESPVDDTAIFEAMATANPLQAQLSSSWAWLPADPTQDNPYLQEFAAQGQNLFSASGDSGSWQAAEFVWPSDSIYLTSVGGTDLTTTGAGGAWSSETAWSDSGGGYSPNKFAIPSWQSAAAAGCAKCSKTYRNGPDVSANANFTFYVCSDQGHNPYFSGKECAGNVFGGTSFAAPMWAGYLALANEQLLLNGGTKTLGFINPTLYTIYGGSSYTTDFHDVTSGCQSGTDAYCATTGYDPVTGLGSPNGAALINALAGSPSGSFSLTAAPKAVKIAQGAKTIITITSAITGGFDSAVTIKASGLPSGVTAAFHNNPIPAPGSGKAQMQLTVSSTATTGVATITLTGTGGGLTETTTIKIDVTKATD